MDVHTILLLVEAVVIVGLSSYVWFGARSADEVSIGQWAAFFVLVLSVIGLGVTMYLSPLVMQ